MKAYSAILIFTLSLISQNALSEDVVLYTQDGQDFKVQLKIARQSQTIKDLIEDTGINAPIPLPNITGKTLNQIVDFLNYDAEHKKESDTQIILNKRIKDRWGHLPLNDLTSLLLAVNYLDIQSTQKSDLLVGLCQIYGSLIFSTATVDELTKKSASEYETYKSQLARIPKVVAALIISHALQSVDRIFMNTSPHRRQDAIKQTPLAAAQVVAYIAAHNTPTMEALPKSFQATLSDAGFQPNGEKRIHFGPLPDKWSIWPSFCPLPSNPSYDMYSDIIPSDRYLDNGDGTVTDVCTKLTWEKSPPAMQIPFDAATKHCAKLDKAGFQDWRLPTEFELLSMIDYSGKAPGKDFPADLWNGAWSSSSVSDFADHAWTFLFPGGTTHTFTKMGRRAWCVRGASLGEPSLGTMPHYTITPDTVTDNFTGKKWQRAPAEGRRNYGKATAYCPTLSLGNDANWRSPTVKELFTIVDLSKHTPAINSEVFPATHSQSFESSSLHRFFENQPNSNFVWTVEFDYGRITSEDVAAPKLIRCVHQ